MKCKTISLHLNDVCCICALSSEHPDTASTGKKPKVGLLTLSIDISIYSLIKWINKSVVVGPVTHYIIDMDFFIPFSKCSFIGLNLVHVILCINKGPVSNFVNQVL